MLGASSREAAVLVTQVTEKRTVATEGTEQDEGLRGQRGMSWLRG